MQKCLRRHWRRGFVFTRHWKIVGAFFFVLNRAIPRPRGKKTRMKEREREMWRRSRSKWRSSCIGGRSPGHNYANRAAWARLSISSDWGVDAAVLLLQRKSEREGARQKECEAKSFILCLETMQLHNTTRYKREKHITKRKKKIREKTYYISLELISSQVYNLNAYRNFIQH